MFICVSTELISYKVLVSVKMSEIASSFQSEPTGSFQNQQPTGSFQNQQPTGSFQNQLQQPTSGSFCDQQNSPEIPQASRYRKRGISAIIDDSTGSPPMPPAIIRPRAAKLVAAKAIERQCTRSAPRGNPKESFKARIAHLAASNDSSSGESADCTTLHRLLSQNKIAVSQSALGLQTYVQQNTSYEVQKANAISIMATAITVWGCNITEAASLAADCTGYSAYSISQWASSFFLSSSSMSPDDLTAEFITSELASNRGHQEADILLHDEDFKLAARTFIRTNACKKGEPNLTSQMFANWIESSYDIQISSRTAARWLNALGFSQMCHQKSVFFDGHDREDVVAYRNDLLKKLERLDRKSIKYDGIIPKLQEGEKPLIRVVHDESTYFANSSQTLFWGDPQTSVIRQKSLGASIMVSDFVDEVHGFLYDNMESARVLLETTRDGYFNNSLLLKQVEKAINIFERVHPEAQGIFLFDNAPSHCKMADDTPNADKMNAGPGGKQPIMKDTMWEGKVQILVDENGIPKGMKAILEERGVDTFGMKVSDMRERLREYPDFNNQKTTLETYIEQRGHICLYYPKFHCELSPIERVWCQSKKFTQKHANGSIVRLRQIVPKGLDSVTVEQIKKYFRSCRDYERAYREGVTGRDVEEKVKIYKSHRRVATIT